MHGLHAPLRAIDKAQMLDRLRALIDEAVAVSHLSERAERPGIIGKPRAMATAAAAPEKSPSRNPLESQRGSD